MQYIESSLALRLSLEEMESAPRVQTLDRAVCVSLSTDYFRKGMNLSLLFPTKGKW